MVWRAQGRKRTSVNTVIKYTYSLHRCSDGCTAHEEQASMAKHPPFDAVPALSNGVWVREKAWVQMLQKQNNRSIALYRHETVSAHILVLFLPPFPDKRQNRKLSGSLLSTVNFFFFYPASSYPTGRRCLRLVSSREPAHSEYQLNVSVSAAVSRRDTSP